MCHPRCVVCATFQNNGIYSYLLRRYSIVEALRAGGNVSTLLVLP